MCEPHEKLCILLEEITPKVEEIGFRFAFGLLGNNGQTVYPVTIGPGVPALAVFFIKKVE